MNGLVLKRPNPVIPSRQAGQNDKLSKMNFLERTHEYKPKKNSFAVNASFLDFEDAI